MKQGSTKSSFRAGMYLLETLTSGMYNNPLSIYREYVQNAVDSIDLTRCKSGKLKVKINIDPFEKSVTITDNGVGIPAKASNKILSSVGDSEKHDEMLRGFRGIGRLGGLAFCDYAVFRTKTIGEPVESIQEWDCRLLRNTLSSNYKNKKTLKDLFDEVTTFYQNNGKGRRNSYFSVKLKGVTSFRNYILDIKKVKNYLSQVAPLPFDKKAFSFGHDVDKYLKNKLPNYSCYEIYLNGDQLFKPYRDKIKTSKKGYDTIDDIEFFEIEIKDRVAARGWYGLRRELIGSISKSELFAGMRVRAGNILIGNQHLLDECFRETRFNGYIVGEIYVDCPDLIPNSRRDDFVDNEAKTLFYNEIEQKIGLPISKEVRLRSRLYAGSKKNNKTGGSVVSMKSGSRPMAKAGAFKVLTRNSEKIIDPAQDDIDLKLEKIVKNICNNCSNKSQLIAEIIDELKKM